MAANLEIRAATAADLPAVKAIYDVHVRSGIATFDTVPPPLSSWDEKLPRMYVACDPSVIGFAYASTYRPRPAYDGTVETTIYLAASAAGRGIGRLLYSTLFERLDREGFHTSVAVIALPNPESVTLHEAFGFTEAGVLREVGHKFGRWIDTALYQRMSAG
jgi:L-amino acid N-acyltransferase YncA